ncbi:MAG: serine/threonine-protein kinase [Gemmatimonadota bacterium]|jgi:serine/threonine-protein kinase
MSPTRWDRIKEILTAALSAHPDQREAIVAELSGGDTALEAEVRSLLDAEADGDRLESLGRSLWGPDAAMPVLVAEALEGRYEVEREIGSGGMATVYLAHDVRHHRKVALKVLDPEVARSIGRERFLAEIRTTAGLQHPNILPLFDSGEANGFLFYVMPFIDGPTLRDRLKEEPQLPVDEAVRIATQVADALAYAHRKGIIHRDVKPANILLQEGHSLVADFGIARFAAAETQTRFTEAGKAIGTPRYMSPEQARAERTVDQRTDVYALGCVLFEMLAGRPPFDGPTHTAVLARLLTGPPPSLARLRPAAAALEPVVARALQARAQDRFPTADTMARAMASVLSDSNRAPSVRGPFRRSWVVGLASAVALVAMGGVVTMSRACTGPGAEKAATIVVLPFRPVGEGAQAIAQGITIATRDRLAGIEGIQVVGGVTSSAETVRDLAPPTVAAEIGADYVLKATVEWYSASDSVEVSPELFGADGIQIDLWRDHPIGLSEASLSEVERTIAGDVARALDLTVGQATRANLTPPRRNPAAYEAYLRGIQLTGEAREARLEEAIALDSTLAPAHAALAYDALRSVLTSRSAKDSADLRDHALAAIRHGPGLPDGYMWMGLFHRTVTRDADSALAYMKEARILGPGNAMVMHFSASVFWLDGQMDSALVQAQRGAGLDPLSPNAVSRVSRLLLFKHSLDEAWARHLEARPYAIQQEFTTALVDGSLIIAAMGKGDSARAYLSHLPDPRLRTRAAVELRDIDLPGWLLEDSLGLRVCALPAEPDWRGRAYDRQIACGLDEWRRGNLSRARVLADSARAAFRALVNARPRDERLRMRLAYAQFVLGERDEALIQADSSLDALNTYWDFYPGAVNALNYVRLAAMAGDAERAVPELRRMLDGYSPLTRAWLRADPAFDPLRGVPAFDALLEDRMR